MSEPESLATMFAFVGEAAVLDGDLVVEFGVAGVIGGPHRHYHWLFRRAPSM